MCKNVGRRFTALIMIFMMLLSVTLPFSPIQEINADSNTDNRTVRLTYEREDRNYDDWDIWVWNTGVQDDNIDFTEFENGLATAFIEVAPTTKEIGFIIRKKDWGDREPNGQHIDRFIQINQQEAVTKATVQQGNEAIHTVPEIPRAQINNGDAAFYYRDSDLYLNDAMDSLEKVELKVAGDTFEMAYDEANERFEYVYADFPEGTYPYSFLVTKDGQTEEVTDLYYEESIIKNLNVDMAVSATITPESINYNENAVLSVNIENESGASIREIFADTSSLGGPEKLNIDPELNEVTIAVKEDIPAGVKEIPLTIVDEFGKTHNGQTTIEVKTREFAEGEDFDWDEAVIYFLLTDRFFDGDESNNDPYGLNYDRSKPGAYHGGDLTGITKKLDYLDNLGVNTIWISPIVENIKYDVRYNSQDTHPGQPFYGYHGYWGSDFENLNPHFGDIEDLHELIDEAAARDMKIMVDVVLNHAGYGLKEVDGELPEAEQPYMYPTDEERSAYSSLLRQGSNVGSDEVTGELAGLPDFITENQQVRAQVIDWQKDWIEKSRTENGNAISYFRVDTVKHVDHTTWKAFKNALTSEDPSFKMIGEAWGASQHEDFGFLDKGEMDSLLDFQFKDIAKEFVNGNLEDANQLLENRNSGLSNTATLGQFLGSHDEDGFLYSIGNDEGKLKAAATLQLTAKGQPVIYYGEELGLSGANNYPIQDNRYNMDFELAKDNAILAHYKKVLDFREEFSQTLSRGSRDDIAGSDTEQFLLVERTHQDDSVYVGLNVSGDEKEVTLTVDSGETVVTDHYSGNVYRADSDQTISISLPSLADGGTVLLTTANGRIIEEGNQESEEIPEDTLRVHYERSDNDYTGLGLWFWGDVETPSEQNGGWPNGATAFADNPLTDYGAYVDIKLTEAAETVGMLVNHSNGSNVTPNISVDILSPEMNEIWLSEDGEVSLYEPADLDPNTLRINYMSKDGAYEPWGVWTWGDVAEPSENWPMGAHAFSDEQVGKYGAYVDVDLNENAEEIGFLLVERQAGGNQTADMSFSGFDEHNQIFLKEGDDTVYTNPYYVFEEGIKYGELVTLDQIDLTFTSTADFSEQELCEGIELKDKDGNDVKISSVTKNEDGRTVHLKGSFAAELAPYLVTFMNQSVQVNKSYKLTDKLFRYDGDDLGATLNKNKSATLKVWSPSADNVSVILYDKKNQDKVVGKPVPMTKDDRGVWEVTLNKGNTGVSNLTGYYYHYEIERDGEKVLALDPYAKSMATWNIEEADEIPIGKAAIVDPSKIGPKLRYADIEGFEEREDAIIYEAHVRDFTSDPSIAGDLKKTDFGTFAAFIKKLDYLEELGVTHIQLLPVMNYYNVNELDRERLLDYSSSDNNYNWGYDPHSYFSLTGMYSEDPDDAEERIKEFKFLIKEIHKRDMGVVLDVVYNHTAKVEIFENLEPNYYHFMDADGTPRESFGGGRLGTTHEMARKVLVDSITYWVDEFKVDGFRFDMMGDHDAETIQIAYDEAKELNPNIIMVGEGWRTYTGDENGGDVMPADQDWMQHTESVASFSDEIRNELKSGFGSEGEPRFLTGGARNIEQIFDNVTANPHNFLADDPGDVLSYIAAHDNLTLHDVIAQSIKKDPKVHEEEIHKRIRLGNTMVLTSQGTAFLHSGQEYGRTKQFRHEEYKEPVANPPYKSTFMTDLEGNPFEYPYFIHDSYDSTDAVNKFDWKKATNAKTYPIQTETKEYTEGLIELRRSTDAFTLGTREEVNTNVTLIEAPEIQEQDLIIGYRAEVSEREAYYVFINADDKERTLTLTDYNLSDGKVIVDNDESGTKEVKDPSGFKLSKNGITIDALTAVIVKVGGEKKPGKGKKR
ncbi:pullulanase [Oceanobacillus chungangensis]|uniref:pullulanase n=1 Tax=Oceanobacillus chungangensis TaxID=1229152 RepID=A0A3D8PM03_9BACI|nr:pullulanase [Oceanobacillus chungangensis]RDW16692.1 pullulanase [Oceanobacillus chungangensis]